MKTAIDKLQKLLDLMILVKPNFIKDQEKDKLDVLNNYRPVFSSNKIQKLSESEIRNFLKFENNLHWSNLQRQGSNLCKDMQNLRDSLELLIDETSHMQSVVICF